MVSKVKKQPRTKKWYDKERSLTNLASEIANQYLKHGTEKVAELPSKLQEKHEEEIAQLLEPYKLRRSSRLLHPEYTFNEHIADLRLAEKKHKVFLRRLAKGFLEHGWDYLDDLTDRQLALLYYSWVIVRHGGFIDELVASLSNQILSMPDSYPMSSFRQLIASIESNDTINVTVISSREEMNIIQYVSQHHN